MTLQEMMQAAASGQGPRYAAGAPSAGGGGVMTGAPPGLDPQIQALIGEATAPEPYAAQPVPEKSKLWQRLLSAVADAGSAYSAGMGAGRPTDFTRALLGRDDYADQVTAANAAGKERSVRQSKKSAAELKLQTVLRQQQAEDERKGRMDLKQAQIDQQNVALQQAKDLAQQQHDFQKQEQTDRLAAEAESHRLEREKDIAVARIHASANDGDAHAKFDVKTLPEVMGNLNQLAQAVPTYLSGDPTRGVAPLPESQIWDRVQMGIEASGLSPDGKVAALAHAKKWVGQAIMDFNRSQAAAQQQGTTAEGQSPLQKLGSVLSGKANLYRPGP